MKQKLHKELGVLLEFYNQQRTNPPEEFTCRAGLISKPSFFTLKDFQRHLNNPLLKPEWIHIKTAGQMVPTDAALLSKNIQQRHLYFMDKELINQELNKGAAIVLEGLDILDPSINAFCAKLDEGLPCGIANSVAFFSQQQNEAYEGHADSDDVLVVQLDGRKTWHLFEPQQRRYLGNENLNDEKLGPFKHKITLRPGDALYVRAGVPHRCTTEGDFSLHMSFDLLDRTPNVEQITSEANDLYYHACELPYAPGSKVVDKYIEILKSPDFQAALKDETDDVANIIREYRQKISRASGVRGLSKFIS
ncbi:MAG: JmjC domain-containing protein [Gammaproteobacteria bacterium]